MSGWIGVDLDGCLAHYDGWKGVNYIGAPIPKMVERVRRWLAEGQEVRIFTARVAATGERAEGNSGLIDSAEFAAAQERLIQDWCELHLGRRLRVTAVKDYGMVALYDDRCVQVRMNTGELIGVQWPTTDKRCVCSPAA